MKVIEEFGFLKLIVNSINILMFIINKLLLKRRKKFRSEEHFL